MPLEENVEEVLTVYYNFYKATGEMAQWLRALDALAEDLGSILSHPHVVHNHL